MLESVAFQCGVILIIMTSLYSFLIWALAVWNGCRVEKVCIFFDAGFSFWTTKINGIELMLGWLPTGSYVKIAGILSESMDKVPEGAIEKIEAWEFRGKPFLTRSLIYLASPILLTLLGVGLLIGGETPIPISQMLGLFFKIAFFIEPLEAGAIMWNELYQNFTFLCGFLCLFMGLANLFMNGINVLIADNDKGYMLVLFFNLLIIFLCVTFIRLIWVNFSFINMAYFFGGAFIIGLVAALLMLLLAKVLPNH